MKLILQRLSDDWQSAYGHGLVLAETDVDPTVHRGTLYAASGWLSLGLTTGYSRQGGRSTEAHDQCKRILVRPLRRDARRILNQCDELATKWCRKGQASGRSTPELKSRYEERSPMVDCRRAPGRKRSPCAGTRRRCDDRPRIGSWRRVAWNRVASRCWITTTPNGSTLRGCVRCLAFVADQSASIR